MVGQHGKNVHGLTNVLTRPCKVCMALDFGLYTMQEYWIKMKMWECWHKTIQGKELLHKGGTTIM